MQGSGWAPPIFSRYNITKKHGYKAIFIFCPGNAFDQESVIFKYLD